MFFQLDEKLLYQVEKAVCPEGRWFFPDQLGGMLARKMSGELGWPVNYGYVTEVMEGWGAERLKNIAQTIDVAYKIEGPTDYSKIWPAYYLYYLPANFPKIIKVLLELLRGGILPKNLKLLDLGTGPGTVPLAVIYFYQIIYYLSGIKDISLEIALLDRWGKYLELAGSNIKSWQLLQNVPFPVEFNRSVLGCLERNSEKILRSIGREKYNLVFLSHVINEYELEDATVALKVADTALEMVTRDGSLVIIEPATSNCSMRVAGLHWQLINTKKASAFAPCSYPWALYPNQSQSCACWNHAREPWLKPASIALLEKYGSKRKNDVDFNYLVLRKDNYNRYQKHCNSVEYSRSGYVKLNEGIFYYDKKINVIGVATSIYRCDGLLIINICDGTCGVHNYCYIQARGNVWSEQNRVLQQVRHGDFINLRGIRVGPGERNSRYTLNLEVDTAAAVYH